MLTDLQLSGALHCLKTAQDDMSKYNSEDGKYMCELQ